jgi:hypothetical protein
MGTQGDHESPFFINFGDTTLCRFIHLRTLKQVRFMISF